MVAGSKRTKNFFPFETSVSVNAVKQLHVKEDPNPELANKLKKIKNKNETDIGKLKRT